MANLIDRIKEMKAEKEEAKRKAREEEIRKKEAEKAEMVSQLGKALGEMRYSRESMLNKLQAELQQTRKDLAARPNDTMLKKRRYQKLKMYYSFYRYSELMYDQLEMKNDEVMMGQGMAEFAETMKVASILTAQPLENMPDIDKLTRSIQESLQSSGKQFEAIDKLLAGATEARNKSMAIANCSDELIDGLLNGSISLDDETPLPESGIAQADDIENMISQLMNTKS